MAERVYTIPGAYRGNALDGFAYRVQVLPLAPLAAVPVAVAINAEAAFMLESIAGTARNPAAPTVRFIAPAITVDLFDAGSGRALLAGPVHWDTLCLDPTAQPFRLPQPKILAPNAVLTVTVANLDAAQAYNVYITLWGTKIFPFPADINAGA